MFPKVSNIIHFEVSPAFPKMFTKQAWKSSAITFLSLIKVSSSLTIMSKPGRGQWFKPPLHNVWLSSSFFELTPIHTKLLKISAPVSRMINSTIIWCSYPVRRKMGQVTPLIKGDELSMKNYPAAGDCITTYKQHLWKNLVRSIIRVF